MPRARAVSTASQRGSKAPLYNGKFDVKRLEVRRRFTKSNEELILRYASKAPDLTIDSRDFGWRGRRRGG